MIDRLTYTIPEARQVTGLGTTKIYELIGAGVLDARKAGSRTLVTAASINAYIGGLPKADIRTGRTTAEKKVSAP